MARMRSVKPEFWQDQEITRLPRDVRLMYIGMWNLADEHARLQGDPRFIKGQLFPYDDDMPAWEIDLMVDALVSSGKAQRYTVRGAVYLYLPKLSKHQRLEPDKVASRLPSPDEAESETDQSESHANKSAQDSDLSVNGSALSMLHVAGGMEQVSGAAQNADAPDTKSKRGSRLPDAWLPSDADVKWQRDKGIPDQLARRELEKFGNYWRSRSGTGAAKLDWSLTWHNWLLDSQDRSAPAADTQARARIAARAADPLASAR